jgi:hypothetical protein
MINKYPDSKYAPMAFQRLISSFKNEDLLNHQINPDRIGSAINKYMTEYPDEDELYSIITEYDFYFKYTMHYSQEQILSSLENFRKSCRGTKAEKIIENYVLENYCPDNKPNFKNDQAKRLFY